MVKARKPAKKAVIRPVKRKNGACSTCGYTMVWLHGGNCPLCKVCVRCGNRVRHCNCIEGE